MNISIQFHDVSIIIITSKIQTLFEFIRKRGNHISCIKQVIFVFYGKVYKNETKTSINISNCHLFFAHEREYTGGKQIYE